MSILFENLANGCPVYYTGYQTSDMESMGHAFVIDGYDSAGNVHVNWGWNGDLNGYYNLTTLGGLYQYNQAMIYDIVPYKDITLALDLGGGGIVNLVANEGASYEFSFVPDEGFNIYQVIFDGTDVTSQLINGNTFVTPSIMANSLINVHVKSSVIGDMDGSGVIDVEDVNAVINIILKLKGADDYSGDGDMNGDGIIDVEDVNAIINIILKLN